MGFENLDVWKRSARLSAQLYKEFANLKDFGFRDQITRSGLSIPSNIADELVNSWVQIPSRSSINVVAAMSIVFDALSWSASDGKALRPTTTN